MRSIVFGTIIVILIILFFYSRELCVVLVACAACIIFSVYGFADKVYGSCETDNQENWRRYINGAADILKSKKFVVSTHITGGYGDLIACIKIVEILRSIGVPKENINCILYLKLSKEAWIAAHNNYPDKLMKATDAYVDQTTETNKITYTIVDKKHQTRTVYIETVDSGTDFPIIPGKQRTVDQNLVPLVNDVKKFFNQDFANEYQRRFTDSFKIAFASQESRLEGDLVIGETQRNNPPSKRFNIKTMEYDDFITVDKEFNLGFIEANPGSLGMNLRIPNKHLSKEAFLKAKGFGDYINWPVHFCYMESSEKKAAFIERISAWYRTSGKKEVLIILNKIDKTLDYVKLPDGMHVKESGVLSHDEFLNMIYISDYIVGCTGDQSTSEVIALGKFPFHETPDFPLPRSIIDWCHKFKVIPEIVLFSGAETQNYDELEMYRQYSKLNGIAINEKLLKVDYNAVVRSLSNEYQQMVQALKKDYELENNLLGAIIYCMKMKK